MNVEKLKEDYIVSKSINCVAYILLKTNCYNNIKIVENEVGLNVFIIKRSDIIDNAYFKYKNTNKNNEELKCDIHKYNQSIKLLRGLQHKFKNNRREENMQKILNDDLVIE